MAKTLKFHRAPLDQGQRETAVRIDRSVIVQAPAGSGKTSLLTERFLRLLATVDDPQRVLAITFTRGAKAEMHSRVMQALACAGGTIVRPEKMTDSILQAAAAAMEVSAQRNWNLLEQPEQINVQTIDSLALNIAQKTPLTTWLGPGLEPMENPNAFYSTAALRTLQKLEQSGTDDAPNNKTAEAVALLLRHRDNRWQACAELLARMLATRDQWGEIFPLTGGDLNEALLDNEVRPALEGFLQRLVEAHLRALRDCLLARNILCREMLSVAQDFALHFPEVPAHYQTQQNVPGTTIDCFPHWSWLAKLYFTDAGKPRQQFASKSGFSSNIPVHVKKAAKAVAADICDDEELRRAFLAMRNLPPFKFTDEEWSVAKAMFRLLRQALVELQMVFAQSGLVDFTEAGMAARRALGTEDHPSELALELGEQYQHLLVDEFQDTSRSQLDLLGKFISNWDPGEGRTIFLVGDPQQSIYLFRQAEVRLFQHVIANGIANLKPELATLTVNFRSHQALVDAHNHTLGQVFASGSDVPFAPSQAHLTTTSEGPLNWHFSLKPPASATAEEKSGAEQRDAELACDLAQAALESNAAHDRKSAVAILVRTKRHAHGIMRCLHDRKIGFRALELEPLSGRQEVLDVFSLTRAILNPSDRVAWLGLLRAPWCGLGLAALDALAGDSKTEAIAASIAARLQNLSADDQIRARRVLDAVSAAQAQLRDLRLPFAVWTAWQRIGGDACVDAEQYENVCAYFAMLERMDEETAVLRCGTIESEMEHLCAAPNPDPSLRLEIMTIHKAKGLEFDTVIVPQMHRKAGANSSQAVEWIEDQVDGETAWFLAPVDKHGSGKSELREWIRRRQAEKDKNELKRVLYVAATRAERELHLLGSVSVNDDGKLVPPMAGSLLATAWPAAQEIAEQQLLGTAKLPEEAEPSDLAMAAAADIPSARNILCRLPQAWRPAEPLASANRTSPAAQPQEPATVAAHDKEAATHAGFERRAAGTVLHALLEQVARRRAKGDDWATLQSWAQKAAPRIERLLLAEGIPPARVSRYAPNVHQLLQKAVASEKGRWLLDPHPGALTEYPVTGWSDEVWANFRLDRVFAAGDALLSSGESHLWLVDYKSAALAGKDLDAFMSTQAAAYADKMLRYAVALRAALNDQRPVRCVLYFPALDVVHQIAQLD